MGQGAGSDRPSEVASDGHLGVELRHLRYLVAIADAGTFTQAAERIFVAQPTLSQQIRRLEDMIGTPLLDRRRDGVQLTDAGSVLLEESRTVLSLVEHGVRLSRQAAGLGRLRLRFVLPPQLPEQLAAETATRLWTVAALAGVDVTWVEAPPEAGFSLIRQRRADAALGWLASGLAAGPAAGPAALPDSLDVMTLGEFAPEVWVPVKAGFGDRDTIGLAELAAMDVVHGPRRANPGRYDAWLEVLRSVRPHFAFIDPPLRHSLPVALAFATTADRLTAVLTGPLHAAGQPAADARQRAAGGYDMVAVHLDGRPLTATAAVAWSADLPRRLQQVLFDAADAGAVPAAC
jgi:DNA-binding transcriptional LysR family regulator